MSAMTPAKKGLAARMRLARRVADALLPQEDDVIIEAVTSGDVLGSASDQDPARGDFILTALDLRLRVSLLPDLGLKALEDRSILEGANRLLWANPDTLACVLVVDDKPLSCRIVEYGEGLDQSRQSSARRPRGMRGPLRATVTAYLRTVKPEWHPPPGLTDEVTLDYEHAATIAARKALQSRIAASSPIPERKEARQSLGQQDAHWAAQLALLAARGEKIDVDATLGKDDESGATR